MKARVPEFKISLRVHPSHQAPLRKVALTLALLTLVLITAWILPSIPGARGIAGYLPLHMLLETISIVIAMLVFAVGWNAYSSKLPGNIVLLACMFMGVGLLDFSHVLSYEGMPDFVTSGNANKSIDFWLAARSLATAALLFFTILPWRPLASNKTRYLMLASVLALVAAMNWLFLFHQDLTPDTFIPGLGLTPFKINTEYAIIAFNLITALILWLRMRQPQPFHAAALFGAVCTMAIGEFFFTLYDNVTDIYNLLGHIYKAIAYLFIYRAIFVTTVESPYRQLDASQNRLQATLNAIPDLLFEVGLDGRFYGYHSQNGDLQMINGVPLLGKTMLEVLPPDVAQTGMSALHEANETGYAKGEYVLQRPSGRHWFEFSISRKAVEAKQEPRFIILSRNITDRNLAKEQLRLSEALLRQTQSMAMIGSWRLNMPQNEMVWSDETYRIFGIPAGTPVNYEFFLDKTHPDDRELVDSSWKAALKGAPYHIQHRAIVNGETRWLEERAQLDFDAQGNLRSGTGSVQDITESKNSEKALRESEKFLNEAQSIANLGSYALDIGTGRWKSSEVLDRLLGIDETYERSMAGWESLIHPNDRMMMKDYIRNEVIERRNAFNREFRIIRHDDHAQRWVHGLGKMEFDANANPSKLQGTIQDITKKKKDEEHIEMLAHFDQLTGLPNRILLNDRIIYLLNIAQRNNKSLAVMFLDLDHFKIINDTLGHSIGDKLLMKTAKRLKASMRDEDTVSRLGGDEFIMLFPDTDSNGALHIATKLIETISRPCMIEHHHLSITPSIGIAIYPDDGTDFETLLKNADTTMYRVKHENRNNFRFFTQEMQTHSVRNLQLVNALRQALSRNELQVHYQPQVAMQDGRIIGAEALLRWQHPELGTISPAEFIPIAEDSGQIIQIGEWVLRTAIRQMKEWMDSGLPPMVIAVNISAVQFRQPKLTELVMGILDEIRLPHEHLELELTEAVAMTDPQAAIAVMDKLHEHGIRMSIDDFGTGYSSLSYLKRFKVYKLKIDQSFVRNITDDPEDRAIVSAIINMANDLGLHTIAEGVETSGQLAFLRLQGCDEVQGYYFSKPLPAEEFAAFVKDSIQFTIQENI